MNFHALEAFGRVKLSRHFCMRQFLYSEIAATYDWIHRGINMSDRNIRRVLNKLLDKGYLLREPWGYSGNAYQYAINVDCDLFEGYEENIAMLNNFDEYQDDDDNEPPRSAPRTLSDFLALVPTHNPQTGVPLSEHDRYILAVDAKRQAGW